MSEIEQMDLFGSVKHTDDNLDLPEIVNASNSNDLLDYMALVVARYLNADKAFKRGYMLNQLLGNESRLTHDIDFSIMEKECYAEIKSLLISIAEKFKRMNLITEYRVKEDISPTSSGGIDMYNETGKKILGVDVGLHNIMYGTKSYNIKIGEVNAFKIERMLSDKILAILSRKRFRRTKDLYDFYVLTSNFDFNYVELVNCIRKRDNYDDSVWENIPFSDTVLVEYKRAWEKLVLIDGIDGNPIDKPEFEKCVHRFYSIALSIKADESHYKWNCNLCRWSNE